METDGLGPREAACQRAELGERQRGPALVVEADGRRGQRFGIVRCQPGRGAKWADSEGLLGRSRRQAKGSQKNLHPGSVRWRKGYVG